MSAEIANYQARIAQVVARIRQAQALRLQEQAKSGPDVTLLAVSKTFPVSTVEAVAQTGLRVFGENYVQEALEKIVQIKQQNPTLAQQLEWHFIGPIQSNKTRAIAENFAWVQSVDRLKIAERLSQQRPDDMPPLQILLQVNISAEASKNGFAPAAIEAAAQAIQALPKIQLRGLMAIPAPSASLALQRLPFHAMQQLFERLRSKYMTVDTLSLGMSADLEAAILEGSTMVRIGSAIFGERK